MKKIIKKINVNFFRENELNQLRKRNALNALFFFFVKWPFTIMTIIDVHEGKKKQTN